MIGTTEFTRADTLLWLQHLDIFSDVPPEHLELLLEGMSWLELRSGDPLEAEAGIRYVYVIRYGSLGSTFIGPLGTLDLTPSGPGDILGEISVIAGVPRPTKVVALRHSSLLRVEGTAFRAFLERSHRGALQVTQHLARNLAQNLRPRPRAVRPGSIALVALARGIDLFPIAQAIADDATTQHLAAEILSNRDLGLTAAEISAAQMLNDLTILVTCGEDPEWDELCISNADRLLYIDATGHDPLPEPALARILGPGRRAQIDVATFCPGDSSPQPVPPRWKARTDISKHLHLRQGRGPDLAFLSRIIGGRALGLVLAGGGARGFAHLGVIRALRQSGIPIDLLGGTSMGAIIAAGAAFEWDDAELMDRMHQVFAINSPVNDYTLPLIALTRGHKVATRLRQHFGDLAIESAWRPFFAVSTNLSTCRPHIHGHGPVWRALRATSALPGILPPVIEASEVLVDGAIMNNFPVDVMRDLRRGPVIGVAMPADDHFASTISDFESMNALTRFRARGTHPINVFSVISRTATASSLVHGAHCRTLADLIIDPEVRDVGLLNWRSLKQTADAAYTYTLQQIERDNITYTSLLEATAPPG